MVGHQAVVVKRNAVTLHVKAHQLFEVFIVIFVAEDVHPVYASVDNMIEACYLNAWFSWHGFSLGKYSVGFLMLLLSPDPLGCRAITTLRGSGRKDTVFKRSDLSMTHATKLQVRPRGRKKTHS